MSRTYVAGLDKKLVDQILNAILRYTTPQKVILFGSRARGDFKENSDIDIAIDTEKEIFENIKRLYIQELKNLEQKLISGMN